MDVGDDFMLTYKQLYATLCAAQSEAIDLLERRENFKALLLLRKSLSEAEELYIASELDIIPEQSAE